MYVCMVVVIVGVGGMGGGLGVQVRGANTKVSSAWLQTS